MKTVTTDFASCALRYGVPRTRVADAFEAVARMLRDHPEGDVFAIYNFEADVWGYELVVKHEYRRPLV